MTFEQAMKQLDEERKVIEQAQSALQTARILFAIGEDEKAVNLFASVRRNLRNEFRQ